MSKRTTTRKTGREPEGMRIARTRPAAGIQRRDSKAKASREACRRTNRKDWD
jgi:hypothetical protein